jgi:uracil-DNA glycosylase
MTIFIVGEAYGEEEEKQNKPFVGRSGQLLIKTLENIGLKREDFYITNIFMERPPSNEIDYFFGGFKKEICEDISAYHGKFLLKKFKPHLGRLQLEIEELEPKLIIGLGNVPYWCFTGISGGITKARGKILTETYGPIKLKTRYIPTFHPSFMLRNNGNDNEVMKSWKNDLLIAKDYL